MVGGSGICCVCRVLWLLIDDVAVIKRIMKERETEDHSARKRCKRQSKADEIHCIGHAKWASKSSTITLCTIIYGFILRAHNQTVNCYILSRTISDEMSSHKVTSLRAASIYGAR